ncbi:MAG: zinc ABC transporter substrate-binding protein [Aquificaceae bacterium]|nr:zinc ABC transporter substrate-binding protein [Aquificaceae bacterium]MDW8096261.1 zinc ABC transporter substrate-binding protein [Aquificaceae bacterium]MDW8434300.1 zinc ABC transporter substrate-binding protein [Aquificaceae bacterium]
MFAFLLVFTLSVSFAKLKVVVTYPWMAELVKEIGKDRVEVYTIAKPTEDFHHIVPKPSHIAKLRNADLLVINGASLEIGFIPPLIQQSNNPKIQPGREGFIDLSQHVELIEKRETASREKGDVHPEGNPHYVFDPHNIPILARALAEGMCRIRQADCSFYKSNLESFLKAWSSKLAQWDVSFSKLRGTKVIQWHHTFNYLFKKYQIQTVGTVEPLPGIPPTAKHVDKLIKENQNKGVNFVVIEAFRVGEAKTAQRIADSLGARLVILPNDVGVEGVRNLYELYEVILQRLSK